MVNGVAVVDKEKCVACMKCINICPKKLFHLDLTNQKQLLNVSHLIQEKLLEIIVALVV
ncbi:4Fe-4S binding protein [Peptoniphilus harei]|uniref:4Fe-4S binding protein n=1 Tax=Peptoniphilus harei TaxID=54005 RepID=UPI002113E3D2|nr:4Fe-4S binding protein [Peptoniphilus harei]